MKHLKVITSRLEEHHDEIVNGASVDFQGIQSGGVLVEDPLSGNATRSFPKIYEVSISDSDLYATHDRHDLSWLVITARPDFDN